MKRVSHQSDGTYSTHYALTANSVFSGCRMYNTSPLQTTKVKALFYPMLPAFRNSIAFCNVPRIRWFVLLVRAMCRCRWVWSNGWMILTGEERSNRRKTRPSATLSTTNLTWTDPRLNRCLRDDRPATERLNYGRACTKEKATWIIFKDSVRTAQ